MKERKEQGTTSRQFIPSYQKDRIAISEIGNIIGDKDFEFGLGTIKNLNSS